MESSNLYLWVGATKFQAVITDEDDSYYENNNKIVRYTVDEKEVSREDFNALYAFALAGRL